MPRKAARKTSRKAAAKAKSPVRKPSAQKKPPEQNQAASSQEQELRRKLVQKRDEILKETQEEISKYIKGENRQLVETALDDGDWSVIDLSEDINLRKLGTHRETLLKIDEALRKLDENTYGVCEDCEEEISPERLRIMPFAIYCRDCQERREEMEAVEREKGTSYST